MKKKQENRVCRRGKMGGIKREERDMKKKVWMKEELKASKSC